MSTIASLLLQVLGRRLQSACCLQWVRTCLLGSTAPSNCMRCAFRAWSIPGAMSLYVALSGPAALHGYAHAASEFNPSAASGAHMQGLQATLHLIDSKQKAAPTMIGVHVQPAGQLEGSLLPRLSCIVIYQEVSQELPGVIVCHVAGADALQTETAGHSLSGCLPSLHDSARPTPCPALVWKLRWMQASQTGCLRACWVPACSIKCQTA